MLIEAVGKGLITPSKALKKLKDDPTIISKLSDYVTQVEKILKLPLAVIEIRAADIARSHVIRRDYGLFVNDSINVAAAEHAGISDVVTHDDDFKRVPKINAWEPGDEKAEDKVTVIDVAKDFLDVIVPSTDELQLLAHVRQAKDVEGNLSDEEQAVIVCNRLPAKGASTTVHLISDEDRFTDDGFDSQSDDDSQLVRLVSLKSWSFARADENKSFKGLLMNLNRQPVTLRLPENDDPTAEKYLQMGYTLVPHSLRGGQKTVSWYHGPLTTGQTRLR